MKALLEAWEASLESFFLTLEQEGRGSIQAWVTVRVVPEGEVNELLLIVQGKGCSPSQELGGTDELWGHVDSLKPAELNEWDTSWPTGSYFQWSVGQDEFEGFVFRKEA